MPSRRLNPNLVKLHRSYAVGELADRLGVHKNTVRQWQHDGLVPVDACKPILFQGATVRVFLAQRSATPSVDAPARPAPSTVSGVARRAPQQGAWSTISP